MSQLVGAALFTITIRGNDQRLVARQFQEDEPPQDFSWPWWPRGGAFVGDGDIDVGLLDAVWYEQPEITRGISARLGLVGITRDQYGSPLGVCTVRTFRASDGALVHETVSDTAGNFVGSVYDGSAYFIVFYKAGVPDVFGTTVNTLVGS